MTHDIRHNEEESQFETTVDGHTGYAAYELEEPDRIVFTHTIVPGEIEGRGVASAIVKHALDHARAENLKVVPQCGYVAAFIERHPEYQDLVA
ncbi:MAG: GNAT family N-acetyltransferase [Thermoanaerobaculia bacterium]